MEAVRLFFLASFRVAISLHLTFGTALLRDSYIASG